jgi:hypothetical protein
MEGAGMKKFKNVPFGGRIDRGREKGIISYFLSPF